MGPALLAGVRVLDLTTFLSGPVATRALGQLGAEVVKIEPPAGDPTRAGLGRRPGEPQLEFWWQLHRCRRSVVLDLKTAAGVETLRALAVRADVLVENFRPGVMERLGLAPERLRERNPRLVTCSITGFGPEGPAADAPALDAAVQAFAGAFDYPAVFGLPAGPIPLTVADISGGCAAAQAIAAALFARERSGRGCHLALSLAETLLQWLVVSDRTGTLRSPATLVAEGSDGARFVVQTALHFRDRLLEILDREPETAGLARDPRFATWEARAANAEAFVAAAHRAFAARPRAEWLARLAAAGIPAGPVHTIDEALAHPQLAHARATALAGGHRVPLSPFVVDGERACDTSPPPALGEHSAEVLAEWLGAGRPRLAELAAAGAFGPPATGREASR
jgi:crotonobetainyl-CoA:carnitine CoA-transferase CaiB-like acyl-CoA transferase